MRLSVVVLAFVCSLAVPASVGAQVLSAQNHWGIEDGDAGPRLGHVHAECALAQFTRIWSGVEWVECTFVGFENPGRITEFDIRGRPDTDGSDFNIPTPQDFPDSPLTLDPQGEVAYTRWFEIDTTSFPYDGKQQIRIAPIVKFPSSVPQPAGMQTRAILRCTVNVQNGHPERDWFDGRTGRFTEGCEAVGYQNPTSGYARISFFNIHEVAGQTVGDTLTLDVGFDPDACDHCAAKGHPSHAPLARAVVRLDPHLHDHPSDPGLLLWKADGDAAESYHRNLTIDLSGVAAGEHKLLLRVEQPDTILGNTNIGQLTVPFTKAATTLR